MQIIIDTTDTKISVKNKCFFIENKTVSRQISPKRITSIAITSNCTINAAAIKLAAFQQVPILFYNGFGTIQARTWSPYFVNLAALRKKQLAFSLSPEGTNWVIELVEKKIAEQLTNLQRLAKKQPKWKATVLDSTEAINTIAGNLKALRDRPITAVRNSLMGYEGSISRQYFKTLNLFLPKAFQFEKRSRRPALDYFNAGLNYLYGMTYSVVGIRRLCQGFRPIYWGTSHG